MKMETVMLAAKAALVPMVIGAAAYKWGPNNFVKAAGAGVFGVAFVSAARQVTGI